MSHILANWLNATTHPQTPIKPQDLDSRYASGHNLLTLLTGTFGLPLPLDAVPAPPATANDKLHPDHSDAVLKNWIVLEGLLRENLGIIVDSNEACDLVRGRPGAAAKLLYQIKSAVSTHGTALPDAPPLPTPALRNPAANHQLRLPSYPSSPRAGSPVSSYTVAASSPKRAFEDHEHQAFARLLRDKLARGPPKLSEPKGGRKTPVKSRSHVPLEGRVRKVQTGDLAASRDVGISIPAEAAEPESADMQNDRRPTVVVKHDHALAAKREQRRKDAPVETLRAEITSFEKRLREFTHHSITPLTPETPGGGRRTSKAVPSHLFHVGGSNPHSRKGTPRGRTAGTEEEQEEGPPLDAESIKKFVLMQAGMDAPHHLKMLARALPPLEETAVQKREYLESIRLRKQEDESSRREREQRRRKRALEDSRVQEEREVAQLEEVALSKLLRQSKQERRIAEQLLKVRHERAVMQSNRVFLESQYTQRRQRDYEEALAREYDLCERAREDYRKATALQLAQHREILADKAREKHRKREASCRDIVLDVLDLAMKVADFRTLNDGRDVPKKFLEEWKLLFGHGKPLTRQYNPELEKDQLDSSLYEATAEGEAGAVVLASGANQSPSEIAAASAAAALHTEKEGIASGIKVLDDREFEDYLTGKGDWSYGGDLPPKVLRNKALGKMVGTILDMTAPPDPVIETARLPAVPLKLALIGKPFSGKRTVAKRLAAKYHLTVLSVDELIQNAIKHPELMPPPTPATPTEAGGVDGASKKQSTTSKVSTGAKLEINMLEGGSPDDALLVTLVVEAIQRLLPGSSDDHPSTPSDTAAGGFILTDFPRTRTQAQLLEKELSGYEDPKPVKPGNLKRTPKERTRRRSQIAPSDLPASEGKLGGVTSGLDAVILLEVGNEVAYDRASGRRVDPVTGRVYHLASDPPPTDDPGLLERISALTEEESESNQVHYLVTAFEEQSEPLREWYSRFNNLQAIDGGTAFDHAYESAEIIVTQLIERKEREKERKAKEAAEALENTGDGTKDEGEDRSETAGDEGARAGTASDEGPDAGRLATGALADEEKKGKAASGRVRLVTPAAPSAKVGAEKTAGPVTASAALASAGPGGRVPQSAKERSTVELKDPRKTGPVPATPAFSDRPMTEATERSSLDVTPPMLTRVTTADGKRLPSKELAEVLADEWVTIESTYTDTLKFAFRSLRREKEAVLRYFHATKVNFRRFLERPDHKQQLVELFQTEFNHVEDDLRSDPDAKAELHQRAEDLRDKLWDLSDKRKDEAEAERVLIVEDKWVEEHFVIIANLYIAMVQAEVDRFLGTKQLAADYFKDAYGMVLNDATRAQVKVPLISPTSPATIDLSTIVFAVSSTTESSHKLHRRDMVGGSADSRLPTALPGGGGAAGAPRAAGGKQAAGGASTTGSAVKKQGAPAAPAPSLTPAQPATVGRMASVVEVNQKQIDKMQSQIQQQHEAANESDGTVFADVINACDQALALLVGHDEGTAGADKKDKKKSVVSDIAAETRVAELKNEPEMEMLPEYHQIVDREDQLLRRKLERLKQHAIDNLRSLRSKGIEVFTLLDDWISTRFGSEMDAVREMLNVIKEAIEAEAKLPNRLALHGEKFKVDFGRLTYEPDPEPRPASPVEKQMTDQFTVVQLWNLALQFRDLAPSGIITCKEFMDSFQRLATVAVGTEVLPDQYTALDNSQLQQIAAALDPYETGFVDWRKFVLLSAKVLPAPSTEYLQDLRATYRGVAPAGGWTISRADYLRVPLWFEDERENLSSDAFDAKFHRPGKLKEALYACFENTQDPTARTPQGIPKHKFIRREDLLHTHLTRNFDAAVSGSTTIRSSNDGLAGHGDVVNQPASRAATAPAADNSAGLDGDAMGLDNGSGGSSSALAPPGSTMMDRSRSAAVDGSDGPGITASTHITPGGARSDPSLMQQPKPTRFDGFGFLMSACMDPNPKVGLQKAFAIVSDSEDGACTLQQVYQVFHFGVTIVEETHRIAPQHSGEDPFAMEMLARVFEDVGVADGHAMTCDTFLGASEPYPQLHSCALYQIDDQAMFAIKSRPSSAL